MAHKKKRPFDSSRGKPRAEPAAAEPSTESDARPDSGDTPPHAAPEETMAQTVPADTPAHAPPEEPAADAALQGGARQAGAPADTTSGVEGADTRSETYGVEGADRRSETYGVGDAETRSETYGVAEDAETHATISGAEGADARSEAYGVAKAAETRAATDGVEGADARSETYGVAEDAETHATISGAEGADARSETFGVTEDAEMRAASDGVEEGGTRGAARSPQSAPELAPALAPEAQTAGRERRRAPWGAMLASGLIGGALVALAMGYTWLTYMSDEGLMNVLWARLGAVELAVRDLSTRGAPFTGEPLSGDELAARLAKVEAALAAAPGSGAAAAATPPAEGEPATPDPALAQRLAALEVVAKSLADGLALLDRRADETASAMQQVRARAEAAVRAGAEQGAAARQQPPAIGKAEFDALAARVASLQQAAASLQQSVEQTTTSLQQTVARGTETTAAADRAVRFALVASGLRSAVERGAPYSGEFKAAKALASDPQLLAPLEPFAASGVPTAEALGRELAALAPQLAQTGNAAARDTGYLDRLQAHAERLVRVRPVNEVVGDDVTAVVARIEAKAKQADLAAALTELRKLPESARAPAAAWMKKAEGREAAVVAAQRTENAALAALANP